MLDLTCSLVERDLFDQNHRFCWIRRQISIVFWTSWPNWNFPKLDYEFFIWFRSTVGFIGLKNFMSIRPSHSVSGFSTQVTVNISPFCPKLLSYIHI